MNECEVEVKIKKLYPDAQIPTRGSAAAAGWDLYAYLPDKSSIVISPHTTVKIETGIAMAIQNGYEGEIRPRSGIATKRALAPINAPGTVDADYRGPVIVALHNYSEVIQTVDHSERIAQILFNKVPTAALTLVYELDDTDRGEGGFGSTGTK